MTMRRHASLPQARDSRRLVDELSLRLNVAISRAQCLAIVVGDARIARTEAGSLGEMALLNLFCRLLAEAATSAVTNRSGADNVTPGNSRRNPRGQRGSTTTSLRGPSSPPQANPTKPASMKVVISTAA